VTLEQFKARLPALLEERRADYERLKLAHKARVRRFDWAFVKWAALAVVTWVGLQTVMRLNERAKQPTPQPVDIQMPSLRR